MLPHTGWGSRQDMASDSELESEEMGRGMIERMQAELATLEE